MFSGIIEQTGRVESLEPHQGLSRLCVNPDKSSDWRLGESISINGVCLTLARQSDAGLEFDLGEETLRRSTLGTLKAGDLVNLEQALQIGERLGGHFVSGHVDGLAELKALRRLGAAAEMDFELAAELAAFVANKGSVALDGVSLTPFAVGKESFTVSLIPATLANTTLGFKSPGERVNLEVDLLARYLKQFLDAR